MVENRLSCFLRCLCGCNCSVLPRSSPLLCLPLTPGCSEMHPVVLVVCRSAPGFLHCSHAPVTSQPLGDCTGETGGRNKPGPEFPRRDFSSRLGKEMHPLYPVLPGLPHVSRSCGFLCDKGSTCCTCTPGWAGCRCRTCWELWQHSPWSTAAAWASCQHPCPLFPPPSPEGLELCWALVQGWRGHCWGCLCLAELPICVFSGGHRAVLCAAGLSPMLSAWAACGALFCVLLITWKVPGHGLPLGLPGQETGSPSAVSTALSHLGTGQEGSVLADELLHSGMYFVLCFS